jgi:RHS repeat-associated protein
LPGLLTFSLPRNASSICTICLRFGGRAFSANTSYYHNDHLATPQKMTDATGAVVWSADYKPFGEATVTVLTITNNLRFPGQYFDAEMGLNYNYYRDYNPVIGRYIEADPIGIKKGRNHLYLYVGNNPIKRIDQFGLQWYFQYWYIIDESKWYGRYRSLSAVCKNNCNGLYSNVFVYEQQWGFVNINVKQLDDPSSGENGAKDAADATADLVEAALKSGEGTEEDQWNEYLQQDGQKYCDQLNTFIGPRSSQ